MHKEEYNKRQPTHTYQQPLIPTAAPVPGSEFNRHGGSKSNRRGQTGTSEAFVTTPDDPVIDPLLIDYVATFVPKASGEHFNPHVTTGVALRDYLDKMLAEPFESFTFSPAGAAVYQLGQFGTAAKKLKEWDLKP